MASIDSIKGNDYKNRNILKPIEHVKYILLKTEAIVYEKEIEGE